MTHDYHRTAEAQREDDAEKLVELGLARWKHQSLSNPLCIITDEGKALVAEWSKT